MKYIVYKTTNLINNKIYVGVHKTENPEIFDGYIGCGAYINKPSSYVNSKYCLHKALLKYGVDNFVRTTIKIFDNKEDAFKLESEIVNEEFVKNENTYNMTLGGYIPPITSKTIYQFDLLGNPIKTWDSIKEITNYYGCNKDRISMCIKDKRSFNNYYWSECNNIDINEYRLSSREIIFQYDDSGNFLNQFNNAEEASKKLNLDRNLISIALYEKHKYSNFYFLHADTDINTVIENIENRKLNNKVKVFRYLKSGKFDREYKSITNAANENNTSTGNIIKAIKKGTCCSGYKWSYDKSQIIQEYKNREIHKIKVAQYDKNGKLVKIWDDVKDCQKEFPACRRVCNGTRKSTGGYVFKYVE